MKAINKNFQNGDLLACPVFIAGYGWVFKIDPIRFRLTIYSKFYLVCLFEPLDIVFYEALFILILVKFCQFGNSQK